MPVLLLAGDEDFLLSRRVGQLKAELVDPSWLSFNFQRLDVPGIREVVDAAATLPFGPGKRMVLLDRCDLFTKKKSKGGSDSEKLTEKQMKALLDDFERSLAAVAAETYLVFACPYNFDATLRTSKVVEKHAEIEHFQKERFFVGSHNTRLETWCRKEAHRYGATVDDEAIAYLLDSTEADLRQVANEIEKAAIYLMPEKNISLATISQLSPHHSHVFSLLDHWAYGRRQKALESLNELLSRQSGIPIIAALQTTLSKWVNLKAAVDKLNSGLPSGPGLKRREVSLGEASRKVAAEFGLKPFVVEMDLKRTAAFTSAQLAERKVKLTRLEHMVKTGQMSDVHALTIFISS